MLFYDDIDDALIEGLEQNQDFFTLLLNNEEIKKQVLGIFTSEIYRSLREPEIEDRTKFSVDEPDGQDDIWATAAEPKENAEGLANSNGGIV